MHSPTSRYLLFRYNSICNTASCEVWVLISTCFFCTAVAWERFSGKIRWPAFQSKRIYVGLRRQFTCVATELHWILPRPWVSQTWQQLLKMCCFLWTSTFSSPGLTVSFISCFSIGGCVCFRPGKRVLFFFINSLIPTPDMHLSGLTEPLTFSCSVFLWTSGYLVYQWEIAIPSYCLALPILVEGLISVQEDTNMISFNYSSYFVL